MLSTEKTGAQTIRYLREPGVLHRDTAAFGTYAEYRVLRKDPTIALGRGLLISGIGAGSWSVEIDEGVSPAIRDFVKTLMDLREEVMRCTVGYGRVDFGWMPFEKIYEVKDGLITIRLKCLLHDMTTILIDKHGNFQGYRQTDVQTISVIDIPVEQCLHIAFDVEGSNLYGFPLLENIRDTQNAWAECNAGAKRYDSKIAGSHWIVHYPPGASVVDGETVQNAEIASQLLTALQSSGMMSLPTTTAQQVQELNDTNVAKLYQWKVELISDTGTRQQAFGTRLGYLDSLKIRGLVLPERSMLEGLHGTLAEAETHASMAITHMEEIDKEITSQVNRQIVDPLILFNFGPEQVGKVRLVAAPLVDLKIEFLRKLYLALVPTDSGTIDSSALKESLGVPITETVAGD